MIVPFHPARLSTVNIAVAAASANVQVTSGSGITQVRVMNNGSATTWVAFGTDNTITATQAASVPIPPGAVEVFSVPSPVYAAAIAAASNGNTYFTPGEGI